jgi:hypothetical protein
MTSNPAHVALLVDFDSLTRTGGEPASDAAAVATALLRYAGGVGRVTLARGYADWTTRAPEAARAVHAARVVPVMAVAGGAGEDRSHVRLVVDALEALYAGGEPDAFVLASGDAALLPLVQALRGDGSDVLFVAPASARVDDLRTESDVVATLEEVLAGAIGRASEPRDAREEEEPEERPAPSRAPAPAPRWDGDGAARGGWGRADEDGRGRYGRPERGSASRDRWAAARPAPIDLGSYDWSGFVRLIDELEHRLPFVGVRYLVNKVLGARNCGTDDPRQKRDLINRAVDDGLLEMYEVGNVEDRRDPVTACRLDRKNPVVVSVLGADTATPVVPEAIDAAEVPVRDPAGAGDADLD